MADWSVEQRGAFNDWFKAMIPAESKNIKPEQIPYLKLLFESVLDVSEDGRIFIRQDAPAKNISLAAGFLKGTAKTPYEYDKSEVDSAHVPHPLTNKYHQKVNRLSNDFMQRDPNRSIKEVESLRKDIGGMGGFLQSPESSAYISHVSEKQLKPIEKRLKANFWDEMLPQIDADMIATGNYGSLIHGKSKQKALRQLQNDYQDKAHEVLGRAYQQAAQIFHADQDGKMSRAQVRNDLGRQVDLLEGQNDQRMAELANKIQHEQQVALDKKKHRDARNREEPLQRFGEAFGALGDRRLNFGLSPMGGGGAQFQENLLPGAQGFKAGGKVRGSAALRRSAQEIRSKGRYGDTILAHINPEEARLLKYLGGSGAINPETGLPEYNFFKKMLRFVLPIAGSFLLPGIGSALGLGLGSVGTTALSGLGGALGGMIGHPNQRLGALGGGLLGLAAPSTAGLLGSGASAMGATGLGSALTNLSNIGVAAPGVTGASTAFGAKGAMASPTTHLAKMASQSAGLSGKVIPKVISNPGFWDKAVSLGGKAINMASKAAPIAAVATNYLADQGNKKLMNRQIDEQIKDNERQREIARKVLARQDATEAEKRAAIAEQKRLEKEADDLDTARRRMLTDMEIGLYGPIGTPRKPKDKGYFRGGYVESKRGGVADDIRMRVLPGSYVMDATTVSLAGDGNSDAGAKRLEDWINHRRSSVYHPSIYRAEDGGRDKVEYVPILVSGGEYVVPPKDVELFASNGRSGAEMLSLFRKNLKKQKKLPKGRQILPKTKRLESYV